MVAGAGVMARPKKTKPAMPPPAAEPERGTIIHMKGSPEYSA
jgi:hypothetical protein